MKKGLSRKTIRLSNLIFLLKFEHLLSGTKSQSSFCLINLASSDRSTYFSEVEGKQRKIALRNYHTINAFNCLIEAIDKKKDIQLIEPK